MISMVRKEIPKLEAKSEVRTVIAQGSVKGGEKGKYNYKGGKPDWQQRNSGRGTQPAYTQVGGFTIKEYNGKGKDKGKTLAAMSGKGKVGNGKGKGKGKTLAANSGKSKSKAKTKASAIERKIKSKRL